MDDRKKKNEEAEERSFHLVKSAFSQYASHAAAVFDRAQPRYDGLPEKFRALLPDLDDHFLSLHGCAAANGEFFLTLSEAAPHDIFLNQEVVAGTAEKTNPTESDMDRVRSVLRHLVRDWSAEGASERTACYTPILSELESTFPADETDRGDIRILIPGAGLGRLVYEISQLGFCAQGNEISMYMIVASDFVFNRCREPGSHRVYPYIHQTSNVERKADMLREVQIPDVSPAQGSSDAPMEPGDLSMIAGDFMEIYTGDEHEGKWPGVVTCFFVDTGRNVFEYVEAISHVLPVGGHWINLGPLLYHSASDAGDACVELALDDLMKVIGAFGFDIVREETLPSTYNGNKRSMLQIAYRNAFFHAVKTGRAKSEKAKAAGLGVIGSTLARGDDIAKEVHPAYSTQLASERDDRSNG